MESSQMDVRLLKKLPWGDKQRKESIPKDWIREMRRPQMPVRGLHKHKCQWWALI
jgi:hypothetical protein